MSDIRLKFVIVGDGYCGKTSLIRGFANPDHDIHTLFKKYDADIEVGGKQVKLYLFDMGTWDESQIGPQFYPGTDVILMCFSVDNPNSLENIPTKWSPEVKQYCSSSPVVLVANKKELRYDEFTRKKLSKFNQEPVRPEEGKAMAEKIGAYAYVECSAKWNEGIREVFETATQAGLAARKDSNPFYRMKSALGHQMSKLKSALNIAQFSPKPRRKELVVVGDEACGKTCLCKSFLYNNFTHKYNPTDLEKHEPDDIELDGMKLILWDTSGSKDNDQRTEAYHSEMNAVLICFAVNNFESLRSVVANWAPEIRQFSLSVPILLIANKIDRRTENSTEVGRPDRQVVSTEEGKSVAEKIGAWGYFECSSLTQEGVKEVFEDAIQAARGATIKIVSPFGGSLTFDSIRDLGIMAGIDIVTPLAKNYEKLRLAAKVTLSKTQQRKIDECESDFECLAIILEQWKLDQSSHPQTWSSLLYILQNLNLGELSQQIQDYLSKVGHLKTYHHVLAAQESIEMWFIKVILLGAPRLGKTTVRRRLTGEIKDICTSGESEQPSTGAVESAPGVFIRNLSGTTALITPTEWIASNSLNEEVKMVINFFYSYVQAKSASGGNADEQSRTQFENLATDFKKKRIAESDTSSQSQHKPLLRSKSTRIHGKQSKKVRRSQSMSYKHYDKPQSQPTKSQPMTEVIKLFRSIVGQDNWEHVQQMFGKESAFLKMEDTGGQPEFMDMLPALTIGPALYLLFCKLTDQLQSSYTVSYLSASGVSTIPEESTYTMEEVLLTALASISCLKSFSSADQISETDVTGSCKKSEMTPCESSLAYIVGTHKDMVSEKQIDDFDQKLQQCIRSTDFFREGLVRFASETRMVLAVDNMNGGEEEIKKIQKDLEEGMKQHFRKLRIPASWLVLSLCLRKREERTASLDSVLQLAEALGISSNEALSALHFLHHNAGVLMHFPELENLRDTVICDIQVVYDSATNLIVNTFKFGRVGHAASERFRKNGQFSMKDIQKATEGVSGDYIPLKKLVNLLEHLNIIAPLAQSNPAFSRTTGDSEMMYFMPCVLQNATHEEQDRWWTSATSCLSPAPLFIRYKCGYVPIGVFPAMIASLAGQDSNTLYMIYEGIKKNRVQFRFGRDCVTLISNPKCYAVQITCDTESSATQLHSTCHRVRELIESTIKTVTSRMNYSFHVEYQYSFECPSHPGREHLCVVSSAKDIELFMLCIKNPDNKEPVTMERKHLVWFEDCGVGAPSTDTSSTLPPSARPHLELVLDWGHDGVEKDLSEIADHMLGWEEKLATFLELTPVDVHDIKEILANPVLQRREALRRWKDRKSLKATYGNLLELFVKAGYAMGAEALCTVLRKKYSG